MSGEFAGLLRRFQRIILLKLTFQVQLFLHSWQMSRVQDSIPYSKTYMTLRYFYFYFSHWSYTIKFYVGSRAIRACKSSVLTLHICTIHASILHFSFHILNSFCTFSILFLSWHNYLLFTINFYDRIPINEVIKNDFK